jgi:NAD(P)-dependent dehydrogenase (short-subunit alcohol dehydrogenase family)
MQYVVVITGASSGFGLLTAQALAHAGHIVYASTRDTAGHNKTQVEAAAKFSANNEVDLRTVEMDVLKQDSIDAAISKVVAECGRIDVLIHNAGHMVWGPSEAFTVEQLAAEFDVNVLSTQRVNRAALPYMRKQKRGLMIWISSSSAAGGTPPWLGPYFAAKSAMDSLATVYSHELTLWGIETSIIVPGAFAKGTNHFAHASKPDDTERLAEYVDGPFKGFEPRLEKGFADLVPSDADAGTVAEAIVNVVNAPFGKRPFRVSVDPTQDSSGVVNPMLDRVCAELIRRMGIGEVLTPAKLV